ncbi:PAS domain S-box protein [Thermodesulfobacteriota bacterium]
MSDNESSSWCFLDSDEKEAPHLQLAQTRTETINLSDLFTKDLTSSGSFDVRGDIWATTFGKLIQALPIPAFLIDQSHQIVAANQACAKISPGYAEVLGTPFSCLMTKPSSEAKIKSIMEEVFTTRKTRTAEATLKLGRKKIWGRMTFRSMRILGDKYIFVLVEDLTHEKRQIHLTRKHQEELKRRVHEGTDELRRINERLQREIAERRKTEKALRESEARYRDLFENASDFIYTHDLQGNYTSVNRAVERILGYTSEEFLRLNFRDILEPETYAVAKENFRKKIHNGVNRTGPYEVLVRRKDGSSVWVEVTSRIIKDKGEPIGVHGTARDITDRKKAEDLQLQTEKLKGVSKLASGVAHNFNNLLQIIMNGAQLAGDGLDLGELSKTRKHLDQILVSSRFGAETVKRLQSFANLRSDVDSAQSRVFDLSELVRDASEMTKPFCEVSPGTETPPIGIHLTLEDGCMIEGKQNELFEVVVNLIKNALEALPQGGHVKIASSVKQDRIILTVQDTGIGLDGEGLKRAFDPFWTTKGVNGTGLGLAVSYSIVSRHGGAISLESSKGHGTICKVELPLALRRPVPAAVSSKAPDSAYSILLIDDVEPVVAMLHEGLTQLGHNVFTALSGSSGLEVLQREEVDVVICDLAMPGMSGWQVGEHIKKACDEKGCPKTPFFLLTGWSGQADEKQRMAGSGVDAIVQKPVDLFSLMAVVDETLSQSYRGSPG